MMATILNFPNGRCSAPVRDRSLPAPVIFTPTQPTFGERLVLFMRLNGETLTFWFAMITVGILLAVVIGAYVARLS